MEQKPRARVPEAARKELAAFERREREFRKMERKERALYLWTVPMTAFPENSTGRGRCSSDTKSDPSCDLIRKRSPASFTS